MVYDTGLFFGHMLQETGEVLGKLPVGKSVMILISVSNVYSVCTCAVVQVNHLFTFAASTKYTCLNAKLACARLIF